MTSPRPQDAAASGTPTPHADHGDERHLVLMLYALAADCATTGLGISQATCVKAAERIEQLERELAEEKKLSSAISRDCNDTALQRNKLHSENADLRERLRNAERWMPVSERLPKNSNRVLVAYRKSFNLFRTIKANRWQVYESRYSGGAWRFLSPSLKNRVSRHVTHWMPLPKAPDAAMTAEGKP